MTYPLGILSDEISQDFEHACKLIREWDMAHVELRTMWGKNMLELSESELDKISEVLETYDLQVTAIASPVFKSPRDGIPKETEGDFQLSGYDTIEGQHQLIRRAADLCKRFRTNKIRIFTFWREPWSDELAEDVADKLVSAAKLAQSLDVILAVENEPVCVVGTGKELGALFDVIRQKTDSSLRQHIGVLWDPGNASHGGEENPYPDGYDHLQPDEIVHVHLKDATVDEQGNRTLLPLGEGQIDFVSQFRRLKEDGYKGVVVLEPHYHPETMTQEEATYACVVAAQERLLEAFPS